MKKYCDTFAEILHSLEPLDVKKLPFQVTAGFSPKKNSKIEDSQNRILIFFASCFSQILSKFIQEEHLQPHPNLENRAQGFLSNPPNNLIPWIVELINIFSDPYFPSSFGVHPKVPEQLKLDILMICYSEKDSQRDTKIAKIQDYLTRSRGSKYRKLYHWPDIKSFLLDFLASVSSTEGSNFQPTSDKSRCAGMSKEQILQIMNGVGGTNAMRIDTEKLDDLSTPPPKPALTPSLPDDKDKDNDNNNEMDSIL